MWEDAVKTYFLGVEVYAFGLYAALGAALALIALGLLARRARFRPGTTALTGALAILCGFAVSRLFFCLMDRSLGGPVPLSGMLMVTGGGYSMMGALAGACLGAALAAKWTGQSAARLLDHLAPALLLFIACERLGEGSVEGFGLSRPLVGDLLKGSFLAVEGEYDWALATYLLESFTALALALVMLRDLSRSRRPGYTMILFLLLFGASQVILESLRFDQHMCISFVGLQQVMAMMMLGGAVIGLALRRMKERKKLAMAALIVLPVAVGAGVALEFMIDRTTISRYLLYALFIAAMAAPAWLGILLRRETTDGKA